MNPQARCTAATKYMTIMNVYSVRCIPLSHCESRFQGQKNQFLLTHAGVRTLQSARFEMHELFHPLHFLISLHSTVWKTFISHVETDATMTHLGFIFRFCRFHDVCIDLWRSYTDFRAITISLCNSEVSHQFSESGRSVLLVSTSNLSVSDYRGKEGEIKAAALMDRTIEDFCKSCCD